MREPAARATFSRVASVHLGLARAPDARDVGCAFTDPVVATGEEGVGVVELEHLRAPGRCPAGRGMVSVYFVDAARFRCLEPDDDALIAKARRVLARLHPASAEAIELAHVIRWPVGIAQFGPGRLAELDCAARRASRRRRRTSISRATGSTASRRSRRCARASKPPRASSAAWRPDASSAARSYLKKQ